MLTKNPNYGGYLYEAIVEPYYQTAMKVESWGRPYMPANCTPKVKWDSTNVNLVKFSNGDNF